MTGGSQFIVIAGPNGAGKPTCARFLLPREMAFLNADDVAASLPTYPSRSREADVGAGRIVLERMNDLESQGLDIAIETTLASRSLAARAVRLKRLGYEFRLIFIWTPSAEFSIQRVAERVSRGGHGIPEETIRRRYRAGLKNFFELYRPLADEWGVFDNTRMEARSVIAEGRGGFSLTVHDRDVWGRMCVEAGHEE